MPRRLPPPFKARPAESAPSLSDILSALRPQRTAVPVEDETNGWALTFGDLVLVLLCFFVLRHMAEKQQLLAQLELAEQTTPATQAKRMAQDSSGQNISNIPAKEAEFAERAERTASAAFPCSTAGVRIYPTTPVFGLSGRHTQRSTKATPTPPDSCPPSTASRHTYSRSKLAGSGRSDPAACG